MQARKAVWQPRKAGALALVALIALTGCLGTSDDPPSGSTEAQATVLPWRLTDCTAVAAAVPVDGEAVRARLPEGFTPWTPEEVGLPPHPTADAVLTVEAWRCETGSGLEGERLDDTVFGALEVPTHPPEELREPDVGYTPFSWQMLVPDTPRRDRLQAAGVPALDGSADLGEGTSTPAELSVQASWTVGQDRYTVTGTTQETRDRGTVVEHAFTSANGGFAVWAFTTTDDVVRTGTGTLEMSPGSLAAEIVGADTTQAFLLTAHPGFEDGTITLPAVETGGR